jgi:CHASE3 domain sensor protein
MRVRGKILLPFVFLGLLVSLVVFWSMFHLASTQVAQTTVQTAKNLTVQMRETRAYYTKDEPPGPECRH